MRTNIQNGALRDGMRMDFIWGRGFVAAALIAAATLFSGFASAFEPGGLSIVLKDRPLPTDAGFEMRNMALFMPLDDSLTTALDAEVKRETCAGDCFRMTVADGAALFQAGGGEMLMEDGRKISIPQPFKIGGTYYIPAEAFFVALGYTATWDEKNKTLYLDRVKIMTGAQERLADTLKLNKKKRERVETGKEKPAAGEEGAIPAGGLEYTYENTTKMEAVRVGGDKSKSSATEKGDYYNQYNIRFVGELNNGYAFTSNLKTQQATEPNLKRGEVKRLEMGWEKNRIRIDAYDVQPKYNLNYAMKNYLAQGVNYQRSSAGLDWSAMAGKTPKSSRQSLYTRYVGGAQVARMINEKNNMKVGIARVDVRDVGGTVDMKKAENSATVGSFSTDIGDLMSMKAEFAGSHYGLLDAGQSFDAMASLYNLDYKKNRTSIKTSYERAGSDFYSETASFTRGRREMSVLYNLKSSASTAFGAGYRDKKIKGDTTKVYPISYNAKPFGRRENFKFAVKRNFEKTTGSRVRILDSREFQISDEIGTSSLTIKGSRQKNKLPGKELAYKNQKSIGIKTPLSERLESAIELKNERWNKDRSSVTRQNRIKLDFEPKDWTSIGLDISRYYNTPQNARTTAKISWQKINIETDSEWKFEYKFDNYRDYNVKSMMLSYSFFR